MPDGHTDITKRSVEYPSPSSSQAQMMEVVARAATDPNCDVEKMERLFAMQERLLDREAQAAFNEAFAEMQAEMPPVIRRRKGHNGKYAPWEHIDGELRPIYTKHGFALSFSTERADAETVLVTAHLMHRMGYSRSTGYPVPRDVTGSKNNAQAAGSSITYGRRYTGCAILNVITEGEDDDGASAQLPSRYEQKIKAAQSKEDLRAVLTAAKADNSLSKAAYLSVQTAVTEVARSLEEGA